MLNYLVTVFLESYGRVEHSFWSLGRSRDVREQWSRCGQPLRIISVGCDPHGCFIKKTKDKPMDPKTTIRGTRNFLLKLLK